MTFLTDEDIDYLSKKITEEKEESSRAYYWYKTNSEADAMYIYQPDKEANNKAIVKARFYVDGRKPEIILPE